jgi:hypothetical protein
MPTPPDPSELVPLPPGEAIPAAVELSTNGGPDAREPALPVDRSLMVDSEHWIAYISGRGAYGTGPCGLASLQTLHFATATEPGKPLFEVLIPAGQFDGLYENELVELFRSARKIVIPEGGAPAAPRRFSLSDDT